jgi:large subunit ribosomal protein L31
MQSDIHPTYHTKATVNCAGCGTAYTVGSTKESVQVELCSNCHPFYTGKQKLVDTAGRVDRYRSRVAKAAKQATEAKTAKPEEAPAEQAPKPEDRLAEMKKQLADDEAQ